MGSFFRLESRACNEEEHLLFLEYPRTDHIEILKNFLDYSNKLPPAINVSGVELTPFETHAIGMKNVFEWIKIKNKRVYFYTISQNMPKWYKSLGAPDLFRKS